MIGHAQRGQRSTYFAARSVGHGLFQRKARQYARALSTKFPQLITAAPRAGHHLILLEPLQAEGGKPLLVICTKCGRCASAAAGGCNNHTALWAQCQAPGGGQANFKTKVNRALAGKHPHSRHGNEVVYEAPFAPFGRHGDEHASTEPVICEALTDAVD